MLVKPQGWDNQLLWAAVFLSGLLLEVLAALVCEYWGQRFSTDYLSLGPVLFLTALAYTYLSGQVLAQLFRIEIVAGMSLTLLSSMVAWAALLAGLAFLFFLMMLAVYSTVGVPIKLIVLWILDKRELQAAGKPETRDDLPSSRLR